MKTPFRLRKSVPQPAAAVMLPGDDAGELLRLCARIGDTTLPVIHAVAGGFLVRLPQAGETSYPGVIRLRALSANLFVPVDAELMPTLLDDEAAALVKQRGLVFLPGGAVLEFSPSHVLSAAELLDVPRLPPRSWEPLPPRPDRPDELSEILLDIPDPPPEAIIEAGGTGIGEEAPRPESAGAIQTAASSAVATFGAGLMRLGEALGWKGLAGLGARLIARAVQIVPRLTEKLLGQQEAALRELLRQFREGSIEQALRRALPLNPPGDRGTTPSQDAKLPRHDLAYRLSDLLRASTGPTSIWLGGGNVYHDLEAAYRAAAEEAARRGDHRRAAFIYGKLLRDWRAAAIVLSRGGLHHDAAVLYLEKLSDSAAAARCFEAASEIDRALFLYCQRGEHVEAGDLLMRAGEEERAVEEYIRAADHEAAEGRCLAAGELLASRARRLDLAERFFEAGWGRRPGRDAQGCLMRLAHLHAQRPAPAAFVRLLDEADRHFTREGNDLQAAEFYNQVVALAEQAHLVPLRDDLIDRALLGLAAKLRQRTEDRATAVSQLFGTGRWAPALVRDAEVAVRGLPRPQPARGHELRMKTHAARVTAACAARDSGDVFLGFEDGVLAHFNPRRGTCIMWQSAGDRVVALATDARGSALVVLSQRADGEHHYRADSYLTNETSHNPRNRFVFTSEGVPSFTSIANSNGNLAVALHDGRQVIFLSMPDLMSIDRLELASEFSVAVLLDEWKMSGISESILLLGGGMAVFGVHSSPPPAKHSGARTLHKTLNLPPFAPVGIHDDGAPTISCLAHDRTQVELAFTDSEGVLHWMKLPVLTDEPAVLGHHMAAGQRHLCAAVILPLCVAGVHRDGVAWLARGERGLWHRSHTLVKLPDAVAAFASTATNELVVVCDRGDLVRVKIPG